MKSSRGAAPLVYVGILAIAGVLGWLGLPRLAANLKLHRVEKQVVRSGDHLDATDKRLTDQQTAVGRGIQREATQAGVALGRLPISPEAAFIGARLTNIGAFSNQLFGPAPSADVTDWQAIAIKAFSDNATERAEANRIIAAQQSEVSKLVSDLAKVQKEKADAVAAAARIRGELLTAQATVDDQNGLLAWGKLLCAGILVLWLAATVIGVLAKSNPAFAAASAAIHTIVAPGLQLATSAARKAAQDMTDRVGALFGRIRAEMPAEAAKIRLLGNDVFDEAHKDLIGPIADEVHKAALLARAEAEKLISPLK